MSIKLLSPLAISRISAGEVIVNPAAVIKELVENSIDAGANEIKIVINESGRNLILITDNGSGMIKDDLLLAPDRHTTSKLDEEDIFNIKYFGFRGEALPSIASVSRMRITSKHESEEVAWSLDIEGGEKGEIYPASLSVGTRIEVRDLFFSTPARLKFLKTERTELQYIIDIFNKIALANPSVDLTLSTENREICRYKARGINNNSERIKDVLSNDFIENSATIDEIHNNIKIKGFVSIPTFHKSTTIDQYFFVNNRPVKDKLLNVALRLAYQDFIARDRYPVAVIFLDLPTDEVDVNVHPTKAEVRFRDAVNIRSLVVNAITAAIKNNSKTSSLLASKFIENKLPNNNISFKPNVPEINQSLFSDYKPKFASPSQKNYQTPPQQNLFNKADLKPFVKIHEQNNEEFKEVENYQLGAAVCQLHETYIISQTPDSIIITDQHAAHERIVYEKLKIARDSNKINRQRLLIPEIIELDERRLNQIISHKEELENFGLVIEKFSSSIIINEVPSLIANANFRAIIMDLADELLEYNEKVSLPKLIEHILETFACHNSVRAGRKLNITEMNSLLREIESTVGAEQCNHGRPTYVKFKLSDIERLFARN